MVTVSMATATVVMFFLVKLLLLLPVLSLSSVLQCLMLCSMCFATVVMCPPTRFHIAWLTATRVATDFMT